MKALATAIYGKLAGSSLDALIGGRLFEDSATEGAAFPYVVYFIVSGNPSYPGGSTMEKVLLQFSIFSSNSSSDEIMDILAALQALFDDCSLSPTSETLIYFIRGQLTTNIEAIDPQDGAGFMRHYAQEYELEILRT